MVINLSGTQPQGPKSTETLENKTIDGTQNTVRVNRGSSANRPAGSIIGDLYYNTDIKDLEEYTEDGWLIVAKQVPRVPAIGSATLDGSNNASVSFTPSAYGQPASSYTVQSNPGSYTSTASSSPISISGTNLEIGTAYTFRVKSTGIYGDSAYSAYTLSVTPESTGSFESIATATVGAGGVNGITFNSIPQTYIHLQLRAMVKSSYSGTGLVNGGIQLNGDANGSNYSSHNLNGDGSSAASQGAANYNGQSWFFTQSGDNGWAVAIFDILDYTNTNKFTTIRGLTGVDNNGSGRVSLTSSNWRNASAVTSITLPSEPLWVQHSTFALYGIKGS
jgi:hypothetical protein